MGTAVRVLLPHEQLCSWDPSAHAAGLTCPGAPPPRTSHLLTSASLASTHFLISHLKELPSWTVPSRVGLGSRVGGTIGTGNGLPPQDLLARCQAIISLEPKVRGQPRQGGLQVSSLRAFLVVKENPRSETLLSAQVAFGSTKVSISHTLRSLGQLRPNCPSGVLRLKPKSAKQTAEVISSPCFQAHSRHVGEDAQSKPHRIKNGLYYTFLFGWG